MTACRLSSAAEKAAFQAPSILENGPMKARLWSLVALLVAALGLAHPVFGADQFGGLVIYMDPPIAPLRIAESIAYSRFVKINVAESQVILVNGQSRLIQNAGIIGLFPMPGPDAPAPEVLQQKANDVMARFPSVRGSIQGFLQRFSQAQQMAAREKQQAQQMAAQQRQQALRVPPPVQPQSTSRLVINGVPYDGATLDSVAEDTAKIYHSRGIAIVPFASLTKEQIMFLNATNAKTHIDLDWEEMRRQAILARARRAEEEAAWARESASRRRQELLIKARQLEEAARYEDALQKYQEAESKEDVQRLLPIMALDFEKRKDYESAAEYFEKAGLFSEAGRIRKTHNMAESVSATRLNPEEIFRRCAPATVSIVITERRGVGVGSGFFVQKGGYVLTNHHVISGANTITVVVDENKYPAQVISDSKTPDLALLKIDLAEHPVLQFADSDRVQPGAPAFAIGTPRALPKSITGGMISAVDRSYLGNNVFQMSVLINHGNSGGPLLDDSGKVIGISTFGEGTAMVVEGVALGSDIQGINYAIKGNEARRLLTTIPR
jgi:tetratricopeptide (TPR) repeat protein